MLNTFMETLKAKFYIPLILAFVCAAGLMAEKAINPPKFSATDIAFIEKVYVIKSDEPLPTHLDFKQAMFNYTSVVHFLDNNSQTNEIDFTKLFKTWDLMTYDKQVINLANMFNFVKIADDRLIISIFIDKKNEADANYLHDNIEKFFDKAVEHFFTSMKTYEINATYKKVDEVKLLPKETKAPSAMRTLVKYGVAGAVLGFVLGIFIVAVMSCRGTRNE